MAMSGMGSGLNDNNPTVVASFHAALLRQGLIVLLIVFLVGLAWNALQVSRRRRTGAGGSPASSNVASGDVAPSDVSPGGLAPARYREPAGRRLLRIGFGVLWIFDGILQGQSSMPLGMAPEVIKPAAAVSPGWVQHLVNSLATTWSYHPITAPAATVWIQIGLGAWLLMAARGNASRLAGVASVAWG
jgi:hypothetical protein